MRNPELVCFLFVACVPARCRDIQGFVERGLDEERVQSDARFSLLPKRSSPSPHFFPPKSQKKRLVAAHSPPCMAYTHTRPPRESAYTLLYVLCSTTLLQRRAIAWRSVLSLWQKAIRCGEPASGARMAAPPYLRAVESIRARPGKWDGCKSNAPLMSSPEVLGPFRPTELSNDRSNV